MGIVPSGRNVLTASGLYRANALETAGGFIPGYLPATAREPHLGTPRAELEQHLTEDLQRGPCLIAFSGGRDSSAVLAVAVRVARREGLDDPLPVTQSFPGFEDHREDERFQNLVLAHLGLDAVRLDSRQLKDALGDGARQALARRGPVWPAFLHDKVPQLELAAGGTLVTGEGGDDVLGSQRITPVIGTLRRRRRPNAEVRRAWAYALAPRALRRRALTRDRWGYRSWLTADAAAAFAHFLQADELARPLGWGSSVRRHARSRSTVLGLGSLDALAAEHRARFSHPLLAPRFVDAVARWGGRLGPTTRTEALQHLVGDLLPDEVLRRTSKARFNSVAFGAGARDFIADWDGAGLPEGLVDADALRTEWSRPEPHAASTLLLQHAWWQQHCASPA